MKLTLHGAMLFLALTVSARPVLSQTAGQLPCASCHADKAQALKGSAHAALSCTTCHVGIKSFPHPRRVPLPTCAECHAKQNAEWAQSVHGKAWASGNKTAPTCQTCHGDAHSVAHTHTWAFKKSIPALCGSCHSQVLKHYTESIHGQGLARGAVGVPVCATCHHAHLILAPGNPNSSVYPTHIPETCGQCHGNVRLAREYGMPSNRLLTYDASFHGMMLREGRITVANCASCHGIHLILPSSDPRSSINPKNLPKTCGKCHPGAGTTFAIGPVHVLPGTGTGMIPRITSWVRVFYLIIIPLTIGLMFVHNFGDWLRKLRAMRLAQVSSRSLPVSPQLEPEAGEARMFGFERAQHFLLLASFLVLVWTGFALKYPLGWWARPLLIWESPRFPLRGILHRIAAVVFMAVAAMHVISLFQSKRLRNHWRQLWPTASDLRQALHAMAYNLGLRDQPPALTEYSYIEKVEYWALVWGAAIMTLTGLMLWAHNFILRWLPKAIIDLASTIHFYEAILAALAILVWHFYSVIFDPDVYPMDAAWLTGRSPRRQNVKPPEPPAPTKPEIPPRKKV